MYQYDPAKRPMTTPIIGKRNIKRADTSTKLASVLMGILVRSDIRLLKTFVAIMSVNHQLQRFAPNNNISENGDKTQNIITAFAYASPIEKIPHDFPVF